jgi:integrase
MRVGRHIQKRGDGYRFRARLPQRLVPCYGRTEITVPLATRERRTALRRARAMRVALESLMTDLSVSHLTRAQAESHVRAWIDRARDACERDFVESGLFFLPDTQLEDARKFTPPEFKDTPLDCLSASDQARIQEERETLVDGVVGLDMLLRFAATERAADDAKAAIREDLARGGPPRRELVTEVDKAMSDIAPDLDKASLDGRFFARTLLRGFATLIDEKVAIIRGDLAAIPQAAHLPAPEPLNPAPEQPFLKGWEEFSAFKQARNDWRAETARNAASSRLLFAGLVPGGASLPSSKVDGAIAQKLFLAARQLPALYDKQKSYKGLTLTQCIEKADALEAAGNAAGAKSAPIRRLSAKTVAKHFSNLGELFFWHQQAGSIPESVKCPFDGYLPKKRSKAKARLDRLAWPLDLQEKLFTSPVWSGCQSICRRGKSGSEIHRDALFWAPLIARTLGVRENEICSATVGNVVLETNVQYPPGQSGPDSIWYLQIRNSKSDGSDRDLPVPQLILDMGFLEHRVFGRNAAEPLFPELIEQGAGNSRGAALSGRFTDYRRKIKVYREKVDFHSLRATFATDIANLPGLNAGWGDELTGHTSPVRASVRTLYTKGVLLNNLKSVVDRIRFPGDDKLPLYRGPKGVRAPGSDQEIKLFVTLAEREMRKKASRRNSQRTGGYRT